MGKHVALLRGINVGRAKQVPMAALAEVFVEAGYRDVRTVLRSGNVVFSADGPLRDGAAARLETAVETATGVSSSVLLLTARQLHLVAAQNPLLDVGTDPSRLFVGFTSAPPAPGLEPPAGDLAPEVLVVGERAVYQWCPDGVTASRLPPTFWRQVAPVVTVRNWRTVTRLLTLVDETV